MTKPGRGEFELRKANPAELPQPRNEAISLQPSHKPESPKIKTKLTNVTQIESIKEENKLTVLRKLTF